MREIQGMIEGAGFFVAGIEAFEQREALTKRQAEEKRREDAGLPPIDVDVDMGASPV